MKKLEQKNINNDTWEERYRGFEIEDKDIVEGLVMDFKGRLCMVLEVMTDKRVHVKILNSNNRFIDKIVEPSSLECVTYYVNPLF